MGPRGNAREVFTTFNDYGGWGDSGAASLVGMFAVLLPLLGADAAVHMSEELQDASKQLPRSMIATTVFNGALAWDLGNLDDVIGTPTFQPFMAVFYQATQSLPGTNAMSALIIFMSICCNLSIVATASRQLFAFARDKGVPLGGWFSHVSPGWAVPVNAIFVSWLVSCLLSLINIGSPVAFNSIASISTSGAIASYFVSVACMVRKRIRNEPWLPSHFKMGRWTGLFVNTASLAFPCLFFVMSFFPTTIHPGAAGMNWAILILGAVIVGALLHYLFAARHVYDGPVEYVRKSA